jgi:PAS domain S-box-containing protein
MNKQPSLTKITWQSLKQSADRAQAGAMHEQAIELYSQALLLPDVPWEAQWSMNLRRAESRQMLGESEALDTELTALAEQAEDRGDYATQAQALTEVAMELRLAGDLERSLQLGHQALEAAEKTNRPDLKVGALCAMGITQVETGDLSTAQKCLQTVETLPLTMEEKLERIKIAYFSAMLWGRMHELEQANSAAEQGLRLARSAGQRTWEGIFLNLKAIGTLDATMVSLLFEQALEVLKAVDNRARQSVILMNSSSLLILLGLYERAVEVARQALEMSQAMHQEGSTIYALQFLGVALIETGDLQKAQAYLDEGIDLAQKTNNHFMEATLMVYKALVNLHQDQPLQALKTLEALKTVGLLWEDDQPLEKAWVLAYQAAANCLAGNLLEASKLAEQAASLITPEDFGNADIPVDEIFWWCYRAAACGEDTLTNGTISDEEWQILDMGRQAMMKPVEYMSDAGLRRGYLHRVHVRRLLVREWLKHGPAHDVPAEALGEFARQVQRPGQLNEAFQRLLKVGVRLNAQRDVSRLPAQIVNEVDELTGAERIALVLLDPQGGQRMVEVKLPRQPSAAMSGRSDAPLDPEAFLAEIEHWLEQAASTRQGFIHLLNPDSGLTEQRSVMVTPLVSQDRLLGVIYADLTGCFGRFELEDLDLLGVLSNQSTVAVENADWSTTLEQRVVDRTAELEASNQNLEQRNYELAIINEVQQGLASKLNIQDIYDTVGDKIREIFHNTDMEIRVFDFNTNLEHTPYVYENGERLTIEPSPLLKKGFSAHVIRTGETLVINENMAEELEKYGSYVIPGTQQAISMVFVPLAVGDQVRGLITLSNMEREHAFSDSDVRLLQTLANSMSVALENARLFDETQRLLKETERRAAELAIINSVQAALAAEIDIQGIYDAVGDKIREIFHQTDIGIRIIDPQTNLIHFLYTYENGQRIDIEPLPMGEKGFSAHVIRTGETLVFNENIDEESEKYGSYVIPGTMHEKSAVYVPLLVGEQVHGLIALANMEREHAFNDSDVRLLQTLANSMSVALENARLFDETQRLLKETEQRAAELAIINSVQAALAAKLNIQDIYDTVGDKIREIFHNTDLNIRVFDLSTNLEHFPYIVENGKRVSLEPEPLTEKGFSAHVARTGETLVLNENLAEELEKYGSYTIPGTMEDKSAVFVPLMVGEQVRGLINLANMEREHAFSEPDVRLLQTLANSMSVALENARLFDETQRLLTETERRAAELATINRLGQSLATLLDPQGIYELVGETLSQTFEADAIQIITYDRTANLLHFRYSVEKGERQTITPMAPGGFAGHILKTRQHLRINRNLEQRAAELGSLVLAGQAPKSYLGVPLIAGDEVIGVVSLQDIDREGAFSEADQNLLTTLSLNMGVALENARLYQETQRRADQMALTAEVGREMSATLDLKTVLERIAAHVHNLFQARDTILRLSDPDGQRFPVLVALGKYAEENRGDVVALGQGITGSIAESRQAEIIDDLSLDPRAVHIAGTPEVEEVPETMMCAPLIDRERTIGLLSVYRDRPEGLFTPVDLDFLVGLARQAAVSIDNARLFAEVQRQKEYSETLVQNSPVAIVTTDKGYIVNSWNRAAERLFGYSADEAIGQNLDQLVAYLPDVQAEAVSIDEQTRAGGVVNCITRRCRKDGGLVDVELSGVPVAVDGKQTGVIAIYHDLSELKQAEEAMLESQRRLMDIINFLPDATFVIDSEGKVIAWNRAIEDMTGIVAEEILGKGNYEYALPFYGERRPILVDLVFKPQEELEERYSQIQRHGAVLIGETYVPALRGAARYLMGTASILHDSKGNAVGAIEIIRDITERKIAEEELKQAKEAAEAATQAKSAFLAMMSHEIRTPMNAIIGMSGLLLDTELTPDQRDFAETVRTSGDNLLTIINDILDFSKIEAGRMELEQQPFDLRECVESALDLMKLKASEKGLELAYEMAGDVPPAISGDVTRLRQILVNLLSNALKFTETGEVVVTLEGMGEANPPLQELHFAVRDTGIGIPADRLERLFQAFSQVDASTSRKYGGTGLGLAVSKRLSEMMGGRMWVESEGLPGRGSTFHFTILAASAPAIKARPSESKDLLELRDRRLLIVDDNATSRRILSLQTQSWGMLPRATGSPQVALEWVQHGEPFDAAILDLSMPEMDGITLAGRLRKLREADSLPLVLLSSLGGNVDELQSDLFAASLLKPIRPSALFDALVGIFVSEVVQPAQAAPERPSIDPEMSTRHPLRILLVEDNAVNQKLALRLLSQMGYRADVAANGLEAIQAVERQPYDVVLMDVQMPEMDGLEATRQIRTRWPDVDRPRIIAMTANAMQGDREQCLEAGMNDYLSKPIRVDELVAALVQASDTIEMS